MAGGLWLKLATVALCICGCLLVAWLLVPARELASEPVAGPGGLPRPAPAMAGAGADSAAMALEDVAHSSVEPPLAGKGWSQGESLQGSSAPQPQSFATVWNNHVGPDVGRVSSAGNAGRRPAGTPAVEEGAANNQYAALILEAYGNRIATAEVLLEEEFSVADGSPVEIAVWHSAEDEESVYDLEQDASIDEIVSLLAMESLSQDPPHPQYGRLLLSLLSSERPLAMRLQALHLLSDVAPQVILTLIHDRDELIRDEAQRLTGVYPNQ
jgi:hypothetical protein